MSTSCILVTGAAGQLGQTLRQQWSEAAISQYRMIALTRSELDFANPAKISAVLSDLKPAIIVNAAAYTQVDKAESDSDIAHLVNAQAVGTIAAWAAKNEARLIHLSTDFVFDGGSNTAYRPDQQTNPLGVYGTSKLAGERSIQVLAPEHSAIIRTSWLYSEYGNNFLNTMLRLMNERDALSVVNDQIGSPTSTHGLAKLIFAMILQQEYRGIYHWTDGASISWFQFAEEIQKQALQAGLLQEQIPIHAISSREYPTPARRPAYSVLDRSRAMDEFDCPQRDWKQQLAVVIKKLAQR